MSYSKQTWATGDTVTAEKLNHMEDGIEGAGGGGGAGGMAVIPLEMSGTDTQTSLTWSEIKDIVESGNAAVLRFSYEEEGFFQIMDYHVINVMLESGTYSISAIFSEDELVGGVIFIANSANSKAVMQAVH